LKEFDLIKIKVFILGLILFSMLLFSGCVEEKEENNEEDVLKKKKKIMKMKQMKKLLIKIMKI